MCRTVYWSAQGGTVIATDQTVITGADGVMALACVCHSGQWSTYSKSERAAA